MDDLKKQTEKLLSFLQPIEQCILRLRHFPGVPFSYDDLSFLFGLATEEIRKIETTALRKLREMPECESLH